jgi:hypothetical protein
MYVYHLYLQETQHKDLERQWRIATEMSNLIVYCRSVAFNTEKIRKNAFVFYEMSSFPETKAEKLICQQENKLFLKYHRVCTVSCSFFTPSLLKLKIISWIFIILHYMELKYFIISKNPHLQDCWIIYIFRYI